MKFTYSNPTVIHFGKELIASLPGILPKNKKVLVIYGGGSIKKNGVYDQLSTALAGIDWTEFSGVEPNPTVETLDKAVAIVKEKEIDFILAVGGGSVVDGSKYVAAAAKYDGDGWDILIGKHQVTEAVSLGVILTLPATGSESNIAAVITKAATKDKLPFMAPAVLPKFAILDPDVVKSLPVRQLQNGIVDAWVHVCEQYLTLPTDAMVQDGYAETLLKSLRELGKNFNVRDNDKWRANLMWIANQALNGLIGVGVPQDWATHMIGHELTALYGVDHARSLAIVQPSLLRNQIENKRHKLEQMGKNVFGLEERPDLAEATIAAIESFYNELGVATTLTEYSTDKTTAINDVLDQIHTHGMLPLGENKAISAGNIQEILASAIQ